MILNPLILVTVFLAIGVGVSQTESLQKGSSKPDFSGVWNARIIRQRSDLTRFEISYQHPKLKISETRGRTVELIYYADGRGETNKSLLRLGLVNAAEIRSKTERVGEKFVIASTHAAEDSGRQVATQITDTLEVLADGKTLSLTTTVFSEGNTRQLRKLYDRTEGPNASDINGKWTQKPGDEIVSLIIEHRDPEIKVRTRVLSYGNEDIEDSVYYSDGRGQTNREGAKSVKTITKWSGNSLTTVNSPTGGSGLRIDREVKWQLSKDGKSLSQTTRFSINADNSVTSIIQRLGETKLLFARSSSRLPGP